VKRASDLYCHACRHEHVQGWNFPCLVIDCGCACVMRPNRPTPEGRELGAGIARLCDKAIAEKRTHIPTFPERCGTCAFRLGTIPNGCPETLMDAMKCVLEVRPFMCHEQLDENKEPNGLCAGWYGMMTADRKPVAAPWPFSHEPDFPERLEEIIEHGVDAAVRGRLRL